VTVDPAGKFAYVANGGSNNVSAYTINAATGALTPVAGSPFTAGSVPIEVAVDPTGKFAYVSNDGSDNVTAYAINAATGALAPVVGSPFAAGSVPYGIAVARMQ
jgi:6-phosphogluconolactonase (cycloisomerase 2 family)